jgi:hypothetical protein
MRIFLALASSPVPGFASDLWKRNLHDPLVDLGHDVVAWDGGIQPLFDLDPDDPSTAPVRARFGASLIQAVEEAHRARPLDFVLTYLSDNHLDPAAITHLRDTVAPVINFSCNNVHQFHLVRRTAPFFTACLVPEYHALASYRAVSAVAIPFPMAANPSFYRPLDVAPIYDASFAGQRYADRADAMLRLRSAGIDAHAFGQGWQATGTGSPTHARRSPIGDLAALAAGAMRGRSPVRAVRDRATWNHLSARHSRALHGPVSDQEYVALFSSSRISLGFLLLGDTHRTRRPLRQVRLREFEAPMAGAFYVTEWIEELADYYEIGREIVCYRSLDELVDLCRHYLDHETERERIRRAGHARARRDHTWQRRFEDLFATLQDRGLLEAKRA